MDDLLKPGNSLKLVIQFMLLSCMVIIGTSCGSSDDNDNRYPIIITDSTGSTFNKLNVSKVNSATIKIDVPNLPEGEGLSGFAIDLNENTTGISISTDQCDSGTPFCEKWTFTPGENALIGQYRIEVSAIGETIPVRVGRFILDVLSYGIIITDANDTHISKLNITIGNSSRIRVIVQGLPDSEILPDFTNDLNENETGIVIAMPFGPESCSELTLQGVLELCETWDISAAQKGSYSIRVSAVSATVPVSDAVLDVTVNQVIAAEPAVSISASSHSMALLVDGTIWTWGRNSRGELGDGTTTDSNTPVQVQSLSGVTDISAGNAFSLALRNDGTVWAWGRNKTGQLGDGTRTNRNMPVQVQNISGVVAIAAGGFYSIALLNDGTVWAWGHNFFGELGDGTTTDRNTPVQVKNLSGVTNIAAGWRHSLALLQDGMVWAWGANGSGELGDGTRTTRNTPVQVQDLSGVTAISAGGTANGHSMVLLNDGTIWAWGENREGQLGDGSTINRITPVQVQNLSGVATISAGYRHSIALLNDGTVWTWGQNAFGELGDGTTTNRNTPVQAQNISGVGAISAGGLSMALLNNCISGGTVWSWPFPTASAGPVRVPGIGERGDCIETGAPTVVSISPASGVTDVAIDATLSATFNEFMDAATITSSSFLVNGGAVPGAVSYDSNTRTASFTPTSNLANNTSYTATITSAVTDLAGNSIAVDKVWSFTTTTAPASCTFPNSLDQIWPIDTGLFPPHLFLSPAEAQFVGVACLEGDFSINWTVLGNTPDARNTCTSCIEPNFLNGQGLDPVYPDGANISVDQSEGLNLGRWQVSTQIFNNTTQTNHAGSDSFDIVVDPAAFQIIPGNTWQNITLSLFGDIPTASRTVAVGSCVAGEFELTLAFFGGSTISTECIPFNLLSPTSAITRQFPGLAQSDYTATIRYVGATPGNLGNLQFSRDFSIAPP